MAQNRISVLIALEGNDERLRSALSRAEQGFDRLSGVAQRAGNSASGSLSELRGGLSAVGERLDGLATGAQRLVAAFVAVKGAVEIAKTLDSWNQLNARLKLVTHGTGEYLTAQKSLFEIAQKNGQSLDATGQLYTRMAGSARRAGLDQGQTLKVTEALAMAFRLSGTSASEAESATVQLSQALGSGALRGDEFNSVMENGQRVAVALADGMGKSVEELRGLAEKGQLTSSVVLKALLSQFDKLKEESGTLPDTIGGAWVRVENALKRYLGTADESSGASRKLAAALTFVADNFKPITDAALSVGAVVAAMLGGKAIRTVLDLIGTVIRLRGEFALLKGAGLLSLLAIPDMIGTVVQSFRDLNETEAAVDKLNQSLTRTQTLLDLTGKVLSGQAQPWEQARLQFLLSEQAIERIKTSLPAAGEALKSIGVTAGSLGSALKTAFTAESENADVLMKRLGESAQVALGLLKGALDQRIAVIDANGQREQAALQQRHLSERAQIEETVRVSTQAEADKLRAVDQYGQQALARLRQVETEKLNLARAQGQDTTAIERESLNARLALYGELEAAYRATIDRLIAEEDRYTQAARQAEEERAQLKLSVEDRIRALQQKGMDDYAAYQDKLRQIDEKQAAAQAALSAGNFEQAKRLAEQSMQLAESSASAVQRNGQTVVSQSKASATAIDEIGQSAKLADQALAQMGQAHKNAAADIGAEAAKAQVDLDQLRKTVEALQGEGLKQVSLKIDADSTAAEASVQKLKALTEAMDLTAKVKLEVSQAELDLKSLQDNVRDKTLEAKVKLSLDSIDADFGRVIELAGKSGVEIPAGLNVDGARQTLESFRTDLRTALTEPTAAVHTPKPDLSDYYRAKSELEQTTYSTHVVTVQQVQGNALGGLIRSFAGGGRVVNSAFKRMQGRITGPGTSTSDSIPAVLSNGEFVMRARAVRQWGVGFLEHLNAGVARFSSPLAYALGGVAGDVGFREPVSAAPARDTVNINLTIGGQPIALSGARDQAQSLADALKTLSRGL